MDVDPTSCSVRSRLPTWFRVLNLENYSVGTIPSALVSITSLKKIDLSYNKLSGHIPSSICNCTSLEAINFRENNFEGALPSDIGLFLPNLLELQLRENELRGTIPSSISNASKLTLLDLSYNSFTGHIPMTIGSLKNLQKLDLGHNQLTSESYTPGSSLINSLSNNRHLRKIVLSGNPLDTMLPVSIGNLSTSLEYLELTDCRLQGNIPTEVGSLSSLVSLKLGNNALTGVIPDTIRLLKSLQSLQLHGGNELSGAIPECLSNLTALRNLSLSSNRLASTIPSSLWSLVDILAINLSSNSLQGSLSSGIGEIPSAGSFTNFTAQSYVMNKALCGAARLQVRSCRTDEDMVARVSDFSIAKLVDAAVQTRTMASIGYMAPEHGSSGIVSEKTDVYSFGILLMETFTGKKPTDEIFNGEMNLRRWVHDSLPHAVDTTIDATLLQSDQEDIAAKTRCLKSILKVACFCTAESFSDRKTMAEVESEILKIKTHFLIDAQLMECEDMEIGRSGVRSCSLRDTELTECEELGIDSRISLQELKLATDGFSERNLLELGKSSFVYIGTPKDMPLVAIKIFNLQKGGLEKFKVQCRALSSIRHRNVVKIVKYCSDVGFKALVMEYMPNGSLQSHLRSGMNTLNFLQRLDIMINVASGLCYLHSMRVIHCNLNPTNVLLDKDMVARISGFSFAKCLEEGFAAIKTSRMAVAPGYMTPEYESTKTVSEKTDVYSFGILLMETFTVIRPAEEKNWRSRILFSLQSVDKIADLNFLQTEMEDFAASAAHTSGFLRLIPRLIYCCTTELPEERKTMTEVETELARLKKVLLSRSILSKIGSRQVPSATAVRGMCDIPDDSDQDSGEQGLYSVARYGNQDPLPEAHPN
ncbi:hypothetical protein V6N13_146128 [Hibiscus sabdariffa]